MNRASMDRFIALLCALCLLGAQQFAGAHAIAHFEDGTAPTSFAGASHGGGAEGAVLDGMCETCAALAALSSAAPSALPAFVVGDIPQASPRRAELPPVAAAAAPPYASRAPPQIL